MKLRKIARICRGGGVNYRVALASNSDSHDAARTAFSVVAPFCFTLPSRPTTKR